jgi:arylsulfatase A
MSSHQRLILLLVLLSLVASSLANPKPNIVFILADDLGYGDLTCYNPQSKIPTPHLDKMASQGMRFTDAHSPSAVCTPTRYSLLTGRYSWRSALKQGVLWGEDPLLIETNRLTVASMLRERGYSTACIGKWHLGLGTVKPTNYDQPLIPGPNAIGFDYFFGIPASLDMVPYVYVENERVVEPATDNIAGSKMRRHGGGGFWREGPIAPGFKHEAVLPVLTKKAVEFVRNQSAERPFFLYVALTSPHTPWMPTPEFRGKSGAGWYGDFTVQTDAAVGEVLQALDEMKLSENTLVIVTSDNGAHWLAEDITKFEHRANGFWRGQKADIWEGGHRVPFIARWPGKVPPGSVSGELVGLVDFMATTAAILDYTLPANAAEDSFNFLPLLLGKPGTIRAALVHQSLNGSLAIREGDWKLCFELGSGGFTAPAKINPTPDGPRGQLYNLASDPSESNNLWLDQPEIVQRLTARFERYKKEGRSR